MDECITLANSNNNFNQYNDKEKEKDEMKFIYKRSSVSPTPLKYDFIQRKSKQAFNGNLIDPCGIANENLYHEKSGKKNKALKNYLIF